MARWLGSADMRLRFVGLVAVAALLASCSDSLPTTPTAEWDAARARWAERGPSHYTYETRSICFCIITVTFWHRVEVRDGQVIAVTPIESFPTSGTVPLTTWRTIPQLLERAQPVNGSAPFEVQRIVEYDPTLGYPRRIETRCGPMVADCDNTVEARNLRPVQP
jgi:hypothetical protein